MSDIHCSICNEPWDVHGLSHGDVKAWEADMIRAGKGCPCCVANGKTPMVSYTKPAPEVIFHCNCCDEDMTVDQDEYVYNGNEKFADHDLCPMESVDGDICQECLDNHYSQCDGCKKWIHDENSTYIQHLNKTVCEKCMENYSSCTTCGMIEHFENVTYHDGEDYCSGCAADQLYFCDHCCETVFMEDVVWDDKDRGFCSDKCRDNANPGGIEWTRLKRKLQL